jgi:nucleoside-diphosphate-sugar epimerase
MLSSALVSHPSILNSTLKHGNALKRVVLTSLFVSVFEQTEVPRVFTESKWNDVSVEAVKMKGTGADPFTIYQASKTLAEKAVWEFVATHSSEISWDLVAINPPWILGVSLFVSRFFLSRMAEQPTHTYNLRSALRRQLLTSTHLNVRSMIL